MTKLEIENLNYAIGCLMNGDPESCDHNPDFGLWDDGMDILDSLRNRKCGITKHRTTAKGQNGNNTTSAV